MKGRRRRKEVIITFSLCIWLNFTGIIQVNFAIKLDCLKAFKALPSSCTPLALAWGAHPGPGCTSTAVTWLCWAFVYRPESGTWRHRVLCHRAPIKDQAGKSICESESARSMARPGCAHGCGWTPVRPQCSSGQADTGFHIPDPLLPVCKYHIQVRITSVGTSGSCAKKLAPGGCRNLWHWLHPAVSPSHEVRAIKGPKGDVGSWNWTSSNCLNKTLSSSSPDSRSLFPTRMSP